MSFFPFFFILTVECRQGDVITHCYEADYADGEEGEDDRQGQRQSEGEEHPVEQSACHTGHGIDLLVEDDRHVVQQHVADDAARHTGDAAHDDGHPEGMSEGDGLLDAGDGEECQSERVEDKPGIAQPPDPLARQNDKQQGERRTEDVHDVRHPERTHAEHGVTDGTAADGDGKAAYVASKPVEVLLCSVADAGDGKGECPEELQDYLERVDELGVGVGHDGRG